MTRLLACFAYFFLGVRFMPWVSGIGAFLIAFEILMPGDADGELAAFGAFFLVGVPILLAGPFYRQLIGNRRTALVPGLRFFATGALFLLALGGAALATLVATLVEPNLDPWRVGLLAFAMVSIYLLVSQWLVARPATMIGYFFLPFVVPAFVFSDGFGAPESLLAPWAWIAVASLGWIWLIIVVSRQDASRRWVAGRAAFFASNSETPGFWQLLGASSPTSSFATAAGTLMRGSGDGWRHRLTGALTMVLVAPGAMSGAAMLMAMLDDDGGQQRLGAVFLYTSFVVVCILPKPIMGEWPARLRLLWLRVAGDRLELWRRLERTLLQDIALIATIHLPIAAALLAVYDVPNSLFYLYLAGAALGALTSGYAGFLARIHGWGFVAQGALFFFVPMAILLVGVVLWNSPEPVAVLGLLPLLLVLALAFRALARSRFQRMDWCRIRPKRFPRPPR